MLIFNAIVLDFDLFDLLGEVPLSGHCLGCGGEAGEEVVRAELSGTLGC